LGGLSPQTPVATGLWGIRAKIFRTPKNLPAPTPTEGRKLKSFIARFALTLPENDLL